MIPILIVLLSLGAGLLSAYQYVKQENAEKAADEANKKLSEAQNRIDELQNETLRQVMGFGHPQLLTLDHPSGGISLAVRGSSTYPIYSLSIKVINSVLLKKCKTTPITDSKIAVTKSCYSESVVYNSNGQSDLNGRNYVPLGVILPKGNYSFVVEFAAKHLTALEYMVIRHDKTSDRIGTYYRIFAVSHEDQSFGKMIDEISDPHIDDNFWEQEFFYKKTVMIQHAD